MLRSLICRLRFPSCHYTTHTEHCRLRKKWDKHKVELNLQLSGKFLYCTWAVCKSCICHVQALILARGSMVHVSAHSWDSTHLWWEIIILCRSRDLFLPCNPSDKLHLQSHPALFSFPIAPRVHLPVVFISLSPDFQSVNDSNRSLAASSTNTLSYFGCL